MKKKVILTLTGSYEQGMNANLRILESSGSWERETLQVAGQLPPADNLIELFPQWQDSYRQQIDATARMKFVDVQITQLSCRQLSTQLCFEFNKWLNSKHEKWQKIRDRLQQNLSQTDEILLIIETESWQVQQLPWQLWKLISDDYPHAEIALSAPDYQLTAVISSATSKVRILAILGNTEGIDVRSDRATLESLPNAEVCFLVEPGLQKLTEQLWSQGWDILFFAGHSISQTDGSGGRIYLNRNEEVLTIEQLKYGLLKAIQNGLKLAIFNSCDGLGIARDLAEVNIPQMIVMREPVPDKVAQEFLKYFLQYFSSGESFHLAVRLAREKLQGLEAEFPCASWLPVIFQNPVQVPFRWHEADSSRHTRSTTLIGRNLLNVLFISAAVTSLLMGIRYFGVLQFLELEAFDQQMRLRPQEPPDPRLLIVTVDEPDFNLPEQKGRRGSLSDLALEKLLQQLEQFKPRVIGLDLYRDFPVEPKYPRLAALLRQSDRFISVCKASDETSDPKGVAPPPEVSLDRLGFSDFLTDKDGILRRHLVMASPEPASPCATPYAFSTMVALYYLAAQEIFPKPTPDETLHLGSTLFPRINSRWGGYPHLDDGGYQIMLNYRSLRSPENIADKVTLTQVLKKQIHPNAIKDRAILIGTVANSYPDFWSIPYKSQSPDGQVSGLLVQAQMVSQILSATLDRRPLIWVLSASNEVIWVFGWSLLGGLIALRFKSLLYFVLAITAACLCLYGASLVLLSNSGCWVPLVPPAMALAVTGIACNYLIFSRSK